MKIKFLDGLSYDQLSEFKSFLGSLYPPTFLDAPERERRIVNDVLLPILTDGEGEIPETPDFAALCQKLVISQHQITNIMWQYYCRSTRPLGTRDAAKIMGRSPSTLRRLASRKVVPARMQNGRWVFRAEDLRKRSRRSGARA